MFLVFMLFGESLELTESFGPQILPAAIQNHEIQFVCGHCHRVTTQLQLINIIIIRRYTFPVSANTHVSSQ
jgi:hypothetical protein